MNVDALIILLFVFSIPIAWWVQRRSKLWMPMIAVLMTTIVGIRALFLLEFGPIGMTQLLGGLFFMGLLGVWVGIKRAQE